MVKNTMNPMIKCANCRRMVPANPRVKNQNYCSGKARQRVRKNKWKQSKIASDQDYKNDQRDCHKQWLEQHPGYYRNYRKQNPDYCGMTLAVCHFLQIREPFHPLGSGHAIMLKYLD